MPVSITISDELFEKLQSLARPFIDKDPEDVIAHLLERDVDVSSIAEGGAAVPSFDARTGVSIRRRTPRERGATIELNGHIIKADSVPDLMIKVFEYIEEKGKWDQLLQHAPYKTSSKRYLYSRSPKHPNGNDFFVPVKYKNVFIEAHKNYKSTIRQLDRLLNRLGIKLIYRGV